MSLIDDVTRIATDAADRLLAVWSPDARPADRQQMIEAAERNENLSRPQAALAALRPDAAFIDEEEPPGQGAYWVVDNAEGSVNHVHGLTEWGVSIALVEDGETVLAVFRQPIGDLTYTARRGHGAWLNGRELTVSAKQGLDIGVVGTGQAEAGQAGTYERIGRSITTMLDQALLVRATVPSTFPMLLVAAGHMDAFWQYGTVLPGVAAGALMVAEAGGVVTTVDGRPWTAREDTILLAAPGVHGPVRDALATVA
ncbi:inositol monophosphatase family protein [Actinoplanes sp. NPDC049265]|uniref:inositol monophosphatase family protein n=1 Tax=Actinoplanes sp. NPDC049265 TaxID=3363902 RepID=UPI00371BEEBF